MYIDKAHDQISVTISTFYLQRWSRDCKSQHQPQLRRAGNNTVLLLVDVIHTRLLLVNTPNSYWSMHTLITFILTSLSLIKTLYILFLLANTLNTFLSLVNTYNTIFSLVSSASRSGPRRWLDRGRSWRPTGESR